jgi:hypothetical protein
MPGCKEFEIAQWLRWILKERPRLLANFVSSVDGSRGEGLCKHGEMGIRTEFWSGNLEGRDHTGGL